jgi:hypothetical protein
LCLGKRQKQTPESAGTRRRRRRWWWKNVTKTIEIRVYTCTAPHRAQLFPLRNTISHRSAFILKKTK